MTIEEIQKQIRDFRDARDWMQFHSPKDMAMAISIEAAELMEHFLWVAQDDVDHRAQQRLEGVTDEIADIAIYLFELADNLSIDLLGAMETKLNNNAKRYSVSRSKGNANRFEDT